MSLVGMDGKPLTPNPPAGFYIGGTCPTCMMPVYFHGGGWYIVPSNALGPGRETEIPPTLFFTCRCEVDPSTFAVEIPVGYDLLAERTSIDRLFFLYHALRDRYTVAMDQLQEAVVELAAYRDDISPNDLRGSTIRTGNEPSADEHQDNDQETEQSE